MLLLCGCVRTRLYDIASYVPVWLFDCAVSAATQTFVVSTGAVVLNAAVVCVIVSDAAYGGRGAVTYSWEVDGRVAGALAGAASTLLRVTLPDDGLPHNGECRRACGVVVDWERWGKFVGRASTQVELRMLMLCVCLDVVCVWIVACGVWRVCVLRVCSAVLTPLHHVSRLLWTE